MTHNGTNADPGERHHEDGWTLELFIEIDPEPGPDELSEREPDGRMLHALRRF